MALHNIRFPETVAVGSRGGPGYRTSIVELPGSGQEERVGRWSQPRRTFDVTPGIKTKADAAVVVAFYHARKGALHSFRFKDYRDFTSAADNVSTPAFDDQDLGVGDGSTTQFQLTKVYSSGGIDQTVNVTLPVVGTTKIGFDAVEQGSGWTVDATTGIVTFTSAPGVGVVITAGFEYDVNTRFSKEVDDMLDLTWEVADLSRLPSILLVEVPGELAVAEEFYYGGATDWGTMTGDQAVSESDGRVQRFEPDAAGHFILLPAPSGFAPGGPYFYFINGSGTNTVGVKNEALVSLGTIPVNETRTVILAVGSGGNTWVLY